MPQPWNGREDCTQRSGKKEEIHRKVRREEDSKKWAVGKEEEGKGRDEGEGTRRRREGTEGAQERAVKGPGGGGGEVSWVQKWLLTRALLVTGFPLASVSGAYGPMAGGGGTATKGRLWEGP
jgi:hypothetical protein